MAGCGTKRTSAGMLADVRFQGQSRRTGQGVPTSASDPQRTFGAAHLLSGTRPVLGLGSACRKCVFVWGLVWPAEDGWLVICTFSSNVPAFTIRAGIKLLNFALIGFLVSQQSRRLN